MKPIKFNPDTMVLGSVCKNGHEGIRYKTKTGAPGSCVGCVQEGRYRNYIREKAERAEKRKHRLTAEEKRRAMFAPCETRPGCYISGVLCVKCATDLRYFKSGQCAKCTSDARNAWVDNNTDRFKARKKKWQEENKETQYASIAKWRAANITKVRVMDRESHKNQRAKTKAQRLDIHT